MSGPKRYRALVTGEPGPTLSRQLSARDEAAMLQRLARGADAERLKERVARASREALMIARFELASLGYEDLVLERLRELESA